jgi:adenylate cyclase
LSCGVIADFALAIQDDFRNLTDHHGEPIPFRIGIESGPVVAGIVGTRKFFYDVWGDTVNVASRMESTCIAGKVQIGPSIATSLRENFELRERGNIEVRGKETVQTGFLTGRNKPGSGPAR